MSTAGSGQLTRINPRRIQPCHELNAFELSLGMSRDSFGLKCVVLCDGRTDQKLADSGNRLVDHSDPYLFGVLFSKLVFLKAPVLQYVLRSPHIHF